MVIPNTTHYYSWYSKEYNIVPDPNSWELESSKRRSYSQRLYWEYKYCKSVGGQAFFYTFTYNDISIPRFEFEKIDDNTGLPYITHIPCFNYQHIRLITNGLISKQLRRKFGSSLRYFVACERGEGKGFRGKGKNPHYHVIFFVFPLSDMVRKSTDVPYKRISPIQFCHLCKCVWQYNSSPNKYDHIVADYRSAKFGHCQPGDDLGLITDFDALSYVTKYVIKDSDQVHDDSDIFGYYSRIMNECGVTYHSIYTYYLYMRQNGFVVDRKEFLDKSGISQFFVHRSAVGRSVFRGKDFITHIKHFDYDDKYKSFWSDFDSFFERIYLPFIIKFRYRDYQNKFGSKCRCSKSLGIYGLNFVRDLDSDPHFVLDTSDDCDPQRICLYYYRKIYMDVVRCPYTGNPLYVLNQKGLDLKCKNLPNQLDCCYNDVSDMIDFYSNNMNNDNLLKSLHQKNIDITAFTRLLSSDLDVVLPRYVLYHCIYQYRFYHSMYNDLSICRDDVIDFVSDYRVFLSQNFYSCDYQDIKLVTLIRRNCDFHLRSFDSHPLFIDYVHYFKLIDVFFSCYRSFLGNIKKKDFEEARNLKQKLNTVKFSKVNSI